jgi:hypothetical protein
MRLPHDLTFLYFFANVLQEAFLLEMTSCKSFDQSWNFFFGSDKVRHLVFIVHPKIVKTSDSLP